MADEKSPLRNDEMDNVTGGGYYYKSSLHTDDGFYPFDNTSHSVQCPKCNSFDIWRKRGFFAIPDLDTYWCHHCFWTFDNNELEYRGGTGDW